MGLKIGSKTKTVAAAPEKVKAKAKPASKVLSQEQSLVDELVLIDIQLKSIDAKALMDRVDAIKKVLQSIAKELPQGENVVLKGTLGEVLFSASRKETVITDKKGLILALGQNTFNEIASVSLTELKKYLAENEIEPLVSSGYGSRTLKSVTSYA